MNKPERTCPPLDPYSDFCSVCILSELSLARKRRTNCSPNLRELIPCCEKMAELGELAVDLKRPNHVEKEAQTHRRTALVSGGLVLVFSVMTFPLKFSRT